MQVQKSQNNNYNINFSTTLKVTPYRGVAEPAVEYLENSSRKELKT